MADVPRHRLYATIALALLLGVSLTAFIVSAVPGFFFQTVDLWGHPIPEVRVNGAGAVIVMALLFTAVTGASWLWMQKTASLHLVGVFIAIVAVQSGAYASYELWEYHESPEFCVRSCHVMEPAYEQFADPGLNQVMSTHQEDHTAECLDCHTGPGIDGQVDLMITSMRHIWKYVVTGEYDPDDLGGPDGVKTVPDENCLKCHGDGKVASLPEKHDRFKEQCAVCHSPHNQTQSGYHFPGEILQKEDCSFCHEERPIALESGLPTKHTDIGDEDCRTCHQNHGLKDPANVLGCTDAGCHDDDPDNEASLAALDHFRPDRGKEDCDTCHGGAHNLTGPDFDLLQPYCKDCHTEDKPLGTENLHRDVEGIKGGDCSQCHGADPAPWNDDPKLTSHGSLRCLTCHTEDNDVDAPPLPAEQVVQTQRDWMRANNLGTAEWSTDGRGTHDRDADCNECHTMHEDAPIAYPHVDAGSDEGCDSSCHGWLQQDIRSEGFPAASGIPVYEGPLDPEALLQVPKDVDNDNLTHAMIYDEWGCTGFCHNPAMDLETAEAWGVPMTQPTGSSVKPENLPEGTIHGFINTCTDCHRFESPAGGKDDLHSSHISFVGAEQPAYDTSGEFADTCAYCHSTGTEGELHAGPGGGCYNCHFSGHLPQTYYWGYPPEARPDEAE